MKILSIQQELLYKCTRVTIEVDNKDRMEVIQKLGALGFQPEKEYDFTIERHRDKRSRDANSYMWVLADKIAYKTQTTKEDVYREAVRRVGVFTDVAVVDRAVEDLIKGWSKKGIGWFSEKFDSTLDGCKKIRLYYGSSTYNMQQMSRLIDEIVEEAKGLDIETATPNELARMKSTWGE